MLMAPAINKPMVASGAGRRASDSPARPDGDPTKVATVILNSATGEEVDPAAVATTIEWLDY